MWLMRFLISFLVYSLYISFILPNQFAAIGKLYLWQSVIMEFE